MSESFKSDSNKVVQLNPERNNAAAAHIALTRLPAPMHALRDKARLQLQVMLRELFDRADDALFELADKATNNHEQNLYFDSMREVRIRRRAVEAAFFRSIDIGFAQLLDHNAYRNHVAGQEKEFSLDDLSLVMNDELEEMVATEGMVNKANDQFAEAIQHLTLRIDHLVPIKVYQKNNPLGVDVICNAFIDATKTVEIDVKAKLVLFKLFDNLVMGKLGGFFQALNQSLIEANILPSLNQGPRPRKSTASTPGSPYGAGANATYNGPVGLQGGSNQVPGNNTNRQTNYSPQSYGAHGGSYDEQTNQVLHTLRDLLGSRASSSGQQGVGQEIGTQDLINMLSQAQQRNIAASGNYSADNAVNVREMLNELLRNQQEKPQAINQVDDDVINLVSMMFDFILDDRNLAAPMKALLGRLQIPMVKVAIADKTFFSKGGHPARRLLNEMAMAALGWQESSEENQRKDSLFSKMEETVQSILSEFEADMTIFGTLLADFRAYLEKDKRRAQILEQRTIDAEDGKAKSERARMDVDTALTAIIGDHTLPATALKLLRDAWANVMFITCLKHGTDGEEWQSALTTAKQLVWSLVVPMDKDNRQRLLKMVPELLHRLRQGLEGISYNPFDATQLFKQLESLHLGRLRGDSVIVAVKSEAASAPKPAPIANNAPVTASEPAIENIDRPLTAGAPVISSPKADAAVVQNDTVISAPVNHAPIKPAAIDQALAIGAGPVAPVVQIPAPVPQKPAPQQESAKPSVAETVNAAQTLIVKSPVAEEILAEGDQHLSLVANITQGSWFEMAGEGGQKFRCRLAAIIRPTGKYIFVNRSGMKVAEETRNSFALAMKSGRLRLLDDGMLFDRALEAVIGNLRGSRTVS